MSFTLVGFASQLCLSAKNKSVERAGDVVQITIPVTALAIAFSKDDNEGVKQLFYSVAASTAATWALKLAVNSKRPKGGKYSFPSGHTSLSFSSATFLQRRYGSYYGVPAYAAGSFVGYSRVYAKRHYWSDILGGVLVGALSGYLFTTPEPEKVTLPKKSEDSYLNTSSAKKEVKPELK